MADDGLSLACDSVVTLFLKGSGGCASYKWGRFGFLSPIRMMVVARSSRVWLCGHD